MYITNNIFIQNFFSMKKALLFPLLFIMTTAAFAQHKPIIVTGREQYHNQDTTRTFGVLEMDKDLCIKKLINALGNPDKNTTGQINWNKVDIKGLGHSLQLRIKDGIMTHDPQSKSACWLLFSSEADKQQKLTALTGDQRRDMDMEITDQSGNNIINSNEKELAAKKFLSGLLAND